MITASQVKYVRSLWQQKYRKEHNAYPVEGVKIAKEYLNSELRPEYIFATASFIEDNKEIMDRHPQAQVVEVQDFELEKISSLKTANEVLLVVKKEAEIQLQPGEDEWILLLDTVQDPGNMGTIIRTADWFGIRKIFCSEGCVDVYNPKVVQSTMGSLLRVKVATVSPEAVIKKYKLPVYAATLSGSDLKSFKEKQPGFILVGNESKGISEQLLRLATYRLRIEGGGAESLNVAVATGIICHRLVV